MQVKKFEAPTMQEALKVIKRELGPEAIILSTKHIKSGFGLMSKASVEVTAAVAEKDLKKKIMAEKNLPQEVKEKIWNSKTETQANIYDTYFERQLKNGPKEKVQLSSKRPNQQQQQPQQQAQQQPQQQPKEQAPTQRQLQAARAAKLMETPPPAQQRMAAEAQALGKAIASNTERRYVDIPDDENTPVTSSAAPMRQAPISSDTTNGGSNARVRSLEGDIEQLKSMIMELSAGATSREEGEQDLSDEFVHCMRELAAAGIEKKAARQIIRQAAFDLSPEEQKDEQAILDRVAYYMMKDIEVKDLLQGVGAVAGKSSSTVVALVGPTGVGKTTTIAKIASLGILEKKLRVGLINLDSYKVAAADQLATYAKIMNVPFRSVNTKDELHQAIYDFSSLDLILIDTTGRSQKDQESLLQLRHMLHGVDNLQTVLLISATTKDSDLNEVFSRFNIFNPTGLVFSKLDETSVYGCIYNAHKKTNLPLLYFTVGQRVPEDIEKASGERVVDLVLDL